MCLRGVLNAGAHLFLKGDDGDCDECPIDCEACAAECGCLPNCFTSTLTADPEQANEGDEVEVTFTLTGVLPASECPCLQLALGDLCTDQDCCFATQNPACCYVYEDCIECVDRRQGKAHKGGAKPKPHSTPGSPAAQPAVNSTAPAKPWRKPTHRAPTSPAQPKVPHGRSPGRAAFDPSNIYVELFIIGDATWTDEGKRRGKSGAKDAKAPTKVLQGQVRQIGSPLQTTDGYTDNDGSFTATLTVNGPGPITVLVLTISECIPRFPSAVTINYPVPDNTDCNTTDCNTTLPVAKVALIPKKAHRHVHEHVEFTAIAVDASDNPVVGANITFRVFGDCDPTTELATAVTGAGGIAHITIAGRKPGDVWVVAAAVDAAGAPLVSEPAHVHVFPGGYNYPEEPEERYEYHYRGHDWDHRCV